MSSIDRDTLNRIIGTAQERDAVSQRQFDQTVSRLTGHNPDMIDRYTATPQPGHGPGTYQPRARATARDTVSLFVPQTAFDGSWADFRRAAGEAINWLRSHRYQVEDGQKLCWGPAFDLDPAPLAYRDGIGTVWYNAAIDQEQDFLQARIKARS